MPVSAVHGVNGPAADHVAADAVEAAGINPFLGINPRQLAAAVTRWLAGAASHPVAVARASLLGATRVLRGLSRHQVATVGPGDRRFADPAWSAPLPRRVVQAYLAAQEELTALVEVGDVDAKSAQRAAFAMMLLTEALSPANCLLTNPVALRRALASRGGSLARGARCLLRDVVDNRGLPAQVDRRRFRVGTDLATTPGAVVHRDPVMEVIQYLPRTPTVHRSPLLVVPSQVNRFYVIDLEDERSLVRAALDAGVQVFTISWHNPGPSERDRSLADYVAHLDHAIGVLREVTRSDTCTVLGICAGGITAAVLLARLAAQGSLPVDAATFAVSTLDFGTASALDAFTTHGSVAAATRRSQRRGVLRGEDLALLFAWLRPRELVWPMWVNNVLLGNDPPTNAVLYWSQDVANLPAALHADYLGIYLENLLVRAGGLRIGGVPIDLGRITCDTYVLAGLSDHLSPWQACFAIRDLLPGPVELVAATGGHIQSLLSSPQRGRGARFHTAGPGPAQDADDWLAGSTATEGSWWPHWLSWLTDRSGSRRRAPSRPGSPDHPVLEPAPGTYVHG